MNATRAALIGIVALVLMGLLFLAMSGGNTGPDLDALTTDAKPVPEVAVQARPDRRPPIQVASKGPDGSPIEPTEKTLRTEGLPDRDAAGIAGGPLDEGSWEKRHMEMDLKWHEGMNEGVQRWAKDNDLNSGDRTDLLNTVGVFTKNVVQLREDMRTGQIKPKESRERTLDLRAQVHEDVARIVGDARAEDLSRYLGTQTVGGGW
ncbi:MAG: hypothetical protein R3F61_11285 [Myxococcota bacterium]